MWVKRSIKVKEGVKQETVVLCDICSKPIDAHIQRDREKAMSAVVLRKQVYEFHNTCLVKKLKETGIV